MSRIGVAGLSSSSLVEPKKEGRRKINKPLAALLVYKTPTRVAGGQKWPKGILSLLPKMKLFPQLSQLLLAVLGIRN